MSRKNKLRIQIALFSLIISSVFTILVSFFIKEYDPVNSIQNGMPILICHGSMDPVVPAALGQKSVATLQDMGFEPEYRSYPMEHSLCPQQIVDISDWIGRVFS